MFHIILAEPIDPQGVELLASAPDVRLTQLTGGDAGALRQVVGEADAIIIQGKTVIDLALLETAPHLKVIARAGIGLNNVAVEAATERGIMVMDLPGVYAASAAEYTIGLLLNLLRHIPAADASLRRSEWNPDRFIGVDLYGKTLGLIGLGHVGLKVAELAQAFGMQVAAYDPYVPDEIAHQKRVIMADLDELLARSDIVSLHVPPTHDTHLMIGAEQLAQMKEGAYLINTSWGEAVDQAALCEALRGGHLAGAALDVFPNEPPSGGDELCGLDNVIVTPNLASRTRRTRREIGLQIAGQVLDALRETDFRNVVNMPFVSATGYSRLREYLEIAEMMGILQIGLAAGPIERLEVECVGEALQDQIRPVTVALLKGILSRMVGDRVNFITAPVIAHEQGLRVNQAHGLTRHDYPTLIACRAVGSGWERVIAGTMFGGVEPRILQIGNFRTQMKPEGTVLMIKSIDLPGVIGKVGTLLGEHQINISAMDYGRMQFGGAALSLLTIDSEAGPEVIEKLLAIEPVVEVLQVTF